MANKRDVELLLRATDLSSKTFTDVAAAVSTLTAKLTQQSEAAAKGQVTTRELTTTMRQLDEAGRALANQAGVIDGFRKTSEQLEVAKVKATDLRAAFDAMKATLSAQETVTKAQAAALNKLENAANNAERATTKLEVRLTAQSASLARVGIDTSALAAAEQNLLTVVNQTAAARTAATEAIDTYDARLRIHKASVAETAAAEKTVATAAAKVVADAEAVKTAALLETEVARKKALVQAAADIKAFEAAEVEEARIAGVVAKEAAAVSAFRAASAQDDAARETRARIKAISEQLAASEAAAAKNLAIVKAAQAASPGAGLAGAAGASGAVGAVEGAAEGADKASHAMNGLNLATAGTTREFIVLGHEALVGNFSRIPGSILVLGERMGSLHTIIDGIVANFPLIATGALAVGILGAAFFRAANNAAALREFTSLLILNADGAKYSAAALVAEQREVQRLGGNFTDAGKALRTFIQEGIDPSKLAEFSKVALDLSRIFGTALPEAAKEVSTAFTKGYADVDKLDKAYNFLSLSQQQTIRELFDMGKAVEAQNMAFDIFHDKVDAASKIVGGPFTQAFRSARSAIYDLLDLIANSALSRLAGTTIVFLANRLQDVATGLRVVIAALPGGVGVNNDPVLQQRVLDATQAKRDALAASPITPSNGLPSPAGLLGADGKAMPGSLTVGLGNTPDAAATTRAAQLAAYDSQIGQLKNHIKELGEQQAASDGTALTSGEAKKKIGADQLTLLEREIQARKGLNDQQRITDAGREASERVLNAGGDVASAAKASAEAVADAERVVGLERLAQERALQKQLNSARAAGGRGAKHDLDLQLQGIDDRFQTLYNKLDDFIRKGGTSIGGQSPDDYRKALDAAKEQEKANIRTKVGDAQAKQSESLQQKLAAITEAGDKAQKGNLDAQLDAVTQKYAAIGAKIADYQKSGGGSIGGQSISEYSAQLAAQEDLIKQQVTIKFYTDNINQAIAARKSLFQEINDEVKDGTKTAQQGYDAAVSANGKLSPKIAQMATEAIKFATAMNSAHPSAQLEAFIAKASHELSQATQGSASPTSAIGTETKAVTDAGLSKINDLAKTRNELQTAFQDLANKGIITQRTANTEIEAAYKQVGPEILKAADELQKFVDAQNAAGKGSVALDLVAAKVKEIKAQAEYANPTFVALEKTIENSFASQAVTAIDSITQSIGKAIAGTEKWGDSFKDIALAIGQFFVGFAEDVAKAILKEEALVEIKAIAASLLHDGGTVGPGSSSGVSRAVDPSWFSAAPRYHSGTIVGLGADEQAAILQHGEEVLAKDDPRNVMNSVKKGAANGASAKPVAIRSVLVLDQGIIPQAMSSSEGEQVTISHIKKNITTIRQLVNTGGARGNGG